MAEIRTPVSVNYRYGEVPTPYHGLGQSWDRPIGRFRALAYRYRLAFVCVMLVNVLLTLILLSQLSGPHSRIWVAQVNQNGFIENGGWLKLNTPVPVSAADYFIQQAINSLQNPKSRDLFKQFSSAAAWSSIEKLAETKGRYQVNSVTAHHGHYLVKWQVTDNHNQLTQYSAEVSIGRRAVQTQSDVLNNPFGFYIAQIKLQ